EQPTFRWASLRRVHGIRAYRSADKNGEWLTMSEAAAKLDVTNHRIRPDMRELTAICLLSANGQEGAPSCPCRREQKHLSTEPGDCEKDEPNGPHNGVPPDRGVVPMFCRKPRLGKDPVAFEAAASVGKIFATY